jgi:hypothetical protein
MRQAREVTAHQHRYARDIFARVRSYHGKKEMLIIQLEALPAGRYTGKGKVKMSNTILREKSGAVRDGHDFRSCSECGREYDALAGECPFCAEGQPATFKHKSGTPPDTSLFLGDARRAWLKERHGGIQPTIHAMIDRAMKRNP